jgi:hypothetical protein
MTVQGFSFLHSVQTYSEANPISYPMGTGASFHGSKKRGVKPTTYFHLVPRSRKMELYLHSPICLHGIALI